MNSDFEGIYKFKFFVPIIYILSWVSMIFGPIFFAEVYQTICIVLLIYSLLKTVGLTIGGAVSLYKLNSILSNSPLSRKDSNEIIQEPEIYHAIIIPNYKEEVQLLQETLTILGNHDIAKTDYLVFLAMQQHEKGAQQKANTIIQKNRSLFKYMSYTLHQVREGQAKGKASNVSWCVEHMFQQIAPFSIPEDKILLTILDADSWAPKQYFEEVNKKLKQNPTLLHKSIFCPPQIFTRNHLQVPVVNRVYDMMHSFVHLSNLVAVWFGFPLSNYSLSYKLIKEVDFWDTCADAIGEDFHTCQKCFWKKRAQIETIPIYTAFNQLSLTTGEGYCSDMKARFWQAERHTRGVSDVAYCLRMLFNSPASFKNFIMTVLVSEVYLLAAIIPWPMLALGIQYKIVDDEELHHYPMLMIDILLNLTPAFTTISYVFYEIFKRKSNNYLFGQENDSLWRVIEYPIIFVIALFGYSIPAFLISSFAVLCTQTQYRVAEKVVTKHNQEERKEKSIQNNMQMEQQKQTKINPQTVNEKAKEQQEEGPQNGTERQLDRKNDE